MTIQDSLVATVWHDANEGLGRETHLVLLLQSQGLVYSVSHSVVDAVGYTCEHKLGLL